MKLISVTLIVIFFGLSAIIGITSAFSMTAYEIEVAHNDELFIINGEKYEAKTYCLGWEKDEKVIFIKGSPYGACASAVLYNLSREEKCEVWCE